MKTVLVMMIISTSGGVNASVQPLPYCMEVKSHGESRERGFWKDNGFFPYQTHCVPLPKIKRGKEK